MIYIGLHTVKQALVKDQIKLDEKNKEAIPVSKSDITDIEILEKGISHFNISENDLKGICRLRKIVIARQIIMYAIRMKVDNSALKRIGKLFNRDHSTVIHGIETVNDMCMTDKSFRKTVIEFLDTIH